MTEALPPMVDAGGSEATSGADGADAAGENAVLSHLSAVLATLTRVLADFISTLPAELRVCRAACLPWRLRLRSCRGDSEAATENAFLSHLSAMLSDPSAILSTPTRTVTATRLTLPEKSELWRRRRGRCPRNSERCRNAS